MSRHLRRMRRLNPFALSRRRFLAGAASTPFALSACRDGGRAAVARQGPAETFRHGVASGDPGADRVILWSRISGQTAPVTVEWELALDEGFTALAGHPPAAQRAGDGYLGHRQRQC